MTARRISRRTLLQGIGGVAIGLPLLEEMLAPARAAEAAVAVPVRAFNLFFGLGIPSPLQKEGFEGPLEPLRPFAKKLLILRNVDHVRADEKGANAHYDGSSAAFTAEPPQGTARTGGPSIDQVIRATHYPEGFPPGMIPTLVAGTFFRRDRVTRHTKSFNDDGSVAAAMLETPESLFSRIFGEVGLADDAANPRRLRLRRSVLDAVAEQADYYTGANSPLGVGSRARVADHLDRIREYEHRVYRHAEERVARCPVPGKPGESPLLHGNEADPGGEGIDITLEELYGEWRLQAELYALAVLCDRVRFGSLTFCAAGERIRLRGTYEYAGRKIFEFDDAKQRKKSGAAACSHEWWHDFNESKANEQLRAHAHMKLNGIAHFLGLLDSEEAREANGRTILENALITISTESGDGRHNDVKRELSGIFHAVTGAGGRFATGQILEANAEGLDLYNTLLAGMGPPRRLGPANREFRPVEAIRA